MLGGQPGARLVPGSSLTSWRRSTPRWRRLSAIGNGDAGASCRDKAGVGSGGVLCGGRGFGVGEWGMEVGGRGQGLCWYQGCVMCWEGLWGKGGRGWGNGGWEAPTRARGGGTWGMVAGRMGVRGSDLGGGRGKESKGLSQMHRESADSMLGK